MKRYRAETAKRDRLFLKARRGGMACTAIARRFVVDLKTVYRGIERARLAEKPAGAERQTGPTLHPLSPITALTPLSECPHHGPIRRGSHLVCMVCHQSGLDHLALFRRHPSDTKPDPKPAAKPAPKRTRKERRKTAKPLLDRIGPSHN